jgi:two-component system cell cycle sensor histidine kinase/response regulator CckA
MTQLQNADGDVDRLRRAVAGAAHDLNNLLVVAMGCAELALDDQSLSPGSRRLVQQIVHAVDRARALSERALRTGGAPAPPPIVDVAAWLAESADLLERLVGEGVHLQVQAGAAPLRVSGDPSQIEQAIFNLALNARDAMPDGGTLTIAAAEDAEAACPEAAAADDGSARRVRMTVSDTGSGIEPAMLQHMFEPYVTTKAAGKGSGLGLAVVRTVVDQLGGTVDVVTAPGEGTTFAITLPLAESAEPARSA